MNEFNACPMCLSKNIVVKNNRKWFCPDCGFDLYNNVAAAVGIVIYDKDNNFLFEIRAKNPQKGKLCLPGGFVDCDETAEEAIIRECKEELGINISTPEYLCTFPNTYEYKNIVYKTCDIFFKAELSSEYDSLYDFEKQLKAEESEVQGIKICKINSIQDIDKLPLAFVSAVNTLKVLFNNRGKK